MPARAGSTWQRPPPTSSGCFWAPEDLRFGRAFAADEDLEAKDAVAVIGYGLWQECFGGDPSVLGSARH